MISFEFYDTEQLSNYSTKLEISLDKPAILRYFSK